MITGEPLPRRFLPMVLGPVRGGISDVLGLGGDGESWIVEAPVRALPLLGVAGCRRT